MTRGCLGGRICRWNGGRGFGRRGGGCRARRAGRRCGGLRLGRGHRRYAGRCRRSHRNRTAFDGHGLYIAPAVRHFDVLQAQVTGSWTHRCERNGGQQTCPVGSCMPPEAEGSKSGFPCRVVYPGSDGLRCAPGAPQERSQPYVGRGQHSGIVD